MVKKCCVFTCNGNYVEENKEKVFRLPTEETERSKWLAAILRDNTPDSKIRLCVNDIGPQTTPKLLFMEYQDLKPHPSSLVMCHQVYYSLYTTPEKQKKLVVLLERKYLMKC